MFKKILKFTKILKILNFYFAFCHVICHVKSFHFNGFIGEKFIVYTNLQDNVTKIEFVDVNNVISTIVDNKYDTYENLISTTDNIFNSSTNYFYDELGRNVKKDYMQTELLISLENVYDDKGNVVKTKFSLGNNIYETNYEYDYTNPNQKLKSINLGDISESYTYDKLDRIRSTNLGDFYSKHFNYLQKGDHTSDVVSSETFGENGIVKSTLKYSYDEKGNVTKVFENGELINRYAYDGLSRLIREDNKKLNKTTLFEYDCGGNILSKVFYDYTTKETKYLLDGEVVTYTYPVSGWKDQLQQYNNEKFEYDNMGNPTKYRDNVLEWSHSRRLDKFNNNITYNYNAEGIRTSKTVNGKTINYYLDGSKILAQNDGNLLTFYYGAEGVIGFKYHGVGDYYYKKNIFGDIISIYDSTKQEIVKYVYDAWGNHNTYVLNNGEYVDISLEISYTTNGLNNKTIAELNPFRYRGYYYDVETNLYYLNSRYYDAELGRFINADDISYLDSDSFNGLNLYVYCCNNPVNDSDVNGNWSWKKFWKAVGVAVVAVVAVAAIATVTFFTGGSLTPILIGATIGLFTGAGTSAITQLITTGKIDFSQLIVDASIGMVLGAFGGTGLGHIGMGISNGLTSAAGSIAGDLVEGEGVNYKKAFTTGVISGLLGSLNKGAQYGRGSKAQIKKLRMERLKNGLSDGRLKTLKGYIKGINNFAIPNVHKKFVPDLLGVISYLWMDIPFTFWR